MPGGYARGARWGAGGTQGSRGWGRGQGRENPLHRHRRHGTPRCVLTRVLLPPTNWCRERVRAAAALCSGCCDAPLVTSPFEECVLVVCAGMAVRRAATPPLACSPPRRNAPYVRRAHFASVHTRRCARVRAAGGCGLRWRCVLSRIDGGACAGQISGPCTAGYYCPPLTSAGNANACPAGTYSAATNLFDATQCTACPVSAPYT